MLLLIVKSSLQCATEIINLIEYCTSWQMRDFHNQFADVTQWNKTKGLP